MLKLLIADDEKAIRTSISTLIDWNSLDIKMIGTAKNGIDAYNLILDLYPDIVLTDIKMPGLSGLELIRKIHEISPQTQFIILSGYGEFEFAKEAMQYGVQHYLLKPCSEKQIIDSVSTVRDEYLRTQKKENRLNEQLRITAFYSSPLFANLINCYLTTNPETLTKTDEYTFYSDFHRIISDTASAYDTYYIYYTEELQQQNIMNEIDTLFRNLYPGIIPIYISVRKTIIFFFQAFANEYVTLNTLLTSFSQKYGTEFQHVQFISIYTLMQRITKQVRRYDLITVSANKRSTEILNSGNILRNIYKITKNMYADDLTVSQKNYQLLTDLVMRGSNPNYLHQLASAIITSSLSQITTINAISGTQLLSQIEQINNLDQLKEAILEKIKQFFYSTQNQSSRINISDRIKEYVDNNLSNPRLSLKWIGEKILYMNVDYLSRKFVQETNEHFSQYLMRQRMEKAKILLAESPDKNISFIAGKVGCGNNPQYFSQVFKKYCGVTPSNYVKSLR